MDPPPGFKPIPASYSRNRIKPNNPSISELISELRDTFRKSDFDRVEETLVAREAKLKAEIEEKDREIGLLKENLQLERLEKINVEIELKKVKGERCEVGVLAEKKRLVGESRKGDCLSVSGRRLGKGSGIDIGHSGEDECYSQVTLNTKERQSVIADSVHQSSSGAVQINLATRPVKPIGIMPGNDNNLVEETVAAREGMLKADIEEKIRLLQQKNQSKQLERDNFEIELKTVKRKRCGELLVEKFGDNGYGLCLDDGKVVKDGLRHGLCNLEVLKFRGAGYGDARAVFEVAGEKVEALAEKKRLVGEPSKKDDDPGGRLGIGTLIDVEDKNKDEVNSQVVSNRKEINPCIIADSERKRLSGTLQKNLATRLAELGRNRDISTKLQFLDDLDCDVSSSSSSSSSSSDEISMDNILGSLKN